MNLLRAKDFGNTTQLLDLFSTANKLKDSISQKTNICIFNNKIMASLFFEPSTRTRISFEGAMIKLGGSVVSTNSDMLSCSKGESIAETIKTISYYVDLIVVRSSQPFTEWLISEGTFCDFNVPIINGGDGIYNHPTQALTDLYTIWRRTGHIPSGLKIGIVGDLDYSRAIRSFREMTHQTNEIYLFDNRKTYSTKTELNDFCYKLPEFDIIYLNRIQKERMEFGRSPSFTLTKEMALKLKPSCLIMNPGPRQEELLPELDVFPNNLYWETIENGFYLRMALIKFLLGV